MEPAESAVLKLTTLVLEHSTLIFKQKKIINIRIKVNIRRQPGELVSLFGTQAFKYFS